MKPRGFTLIELLVVIAIIGLLASIVLASLASARTKAIDAGRAASLQEVQKALELYNLQNNGYPISAGSTYSSQCSQWGSVAPTNVIPGLVPTYMPSLPADPSTNGVGTNCYIYISNGTDYKFMDYNLPGSALKPFTALIDPQRNFGSSWANTAACPATGDGTWSLAIWTPGAACW